ncbi:MAG: hypothetical protein MI922_13015, partial [Bacteroidales bacterium]|nr:hypothetical protein [Bacteroidales bacterium]
MRDLKLEWDFSSLVSGDLDEQIEREKVVIEKKIGDFVEKWKEDKSYMEDENSLREVLDELDYLMTNYGTCGDVGQYLWLKKSKDQTDEEVKAKFELVSQFDEKMENLLVFFGLSLGKISKEKRVEFLGSSKLLKYRHYLERVFRRSEFMLDEEVEKVLNLKGGPSYNSWVRMLSEMLSKEEREVFTGEKKEVKNFSEV